MRKLININFVSPCNLICNIPYFCWIITFASRRSNLPLPSLNRGQHSIVFNVNALWSYGELKYGLPQIFPKRRRIHWRAHRSHNYASWPTLLLLNWRGGLENKEVFLRPREIEGWPPGGIHEFGWGEDLCSCVPSSVPRLLALLLFAVVGGTTPEAAGLWVVNYPASSSVWKPWPLGVWRRTCWTRNPIRRWEGLQTGVWALGRWTFGSIWELLRLLLLLWHHSANASDLEKKKEHTIMS